MIRRCSGSTARSPRSRSTGQVRSIRSICRSRKSSSNSAQMSKHPTRSRCSSSKAKAGHSAQAAICRPLERLRRPTTSRRSSANCSSIIMPSSPRCGECPRSCCRAFTVRLRVPGCRSLLWQTCASPPKTPASPRPIPSSAYRPMAAARSAWPQASVPGAPCKSFLPKTAFRQRKPMSGDLSRKLSRPPN